MGTRNLNCNHTQNHSLACRLTSGILKHNRGASECGELRRGVLCPALCDLVKSLASAFWSRWRHDKKKIKKEVWVMLKYKELRESKQEEMKARMMTSSRWETRRVVVKYRTVMRCDRDWFTGRFDAESNMTQRVLAVLWETETKHPTALSAHTDVPLLFFNFWMIHYYVLFWTNNLF